MIDPGEVGHDDGDGEGDDEHSAERADAADDLAQHGGGHHVAVAQRRHGHDGVPERGRDGREGGVLHALLAVEHDGGENDDGHGQREHQEAQLGRARLKGVAQDTETLDYRNKSIM